MSWWKRAFQRPRAPKTSDAAVRQALYALLDHDLDSAQDLLARAAQLDPDEIDAHLILGRLHRERGEVGRAIRIHQNLLLRPQLDDERATEVLRELASDFRAGGFLRRAIASFEEVLSRAPRDERSLRELAGLLASARDLERAIEIERRLARVRGGDAAGRESELQVEIARAAEAEGRTADARKALRRATRRDPRNVEAWLLLGVVRQRHSQFRRALRAFRRAVALQPDLGDAHNRLGVLLAARGKDVEGYHHLRKASELMPHDSSPWLHLAQVCLRLGWRDDALDALERAERLGGHEAELEQVRKLFGETGS